MHEHDRDQPVDVEGLYMDRVPRASLEDEVVEELRGRGALYRSKMPLRAGLLRAAAAIVFFLAGWGTAQIGVASPVDGQYMLLLWEGPDFQVEESLAEEYGAWGRDVGEGGIPISGDELGPSRRMLGPTSLVARGAAAATGPSTEYRVGGYFMVGAREEEALELAESHPHRRYGGWIEVVPVVVR